MHTYLTSPRSSATLSLLLCLPLVIIFPIMALEIEPFRTALNRLVVKSDGYSTTTFGYALMLFLMASVPAAFIVSIVPPIRSLRVGRGLGAHRVNLALAAVLFLLIAAFVTGFVVDQYPCWIGVPNCD